MHTRRPATNVSQLSGTASYSDDFSRMGSPRTTFPLSAVRASYRFLVRRRVSISLVSFTLLLTTEGLLGVGWHRVNLQTDILFGMAVACVVIGVGIRSWAAGTIRKNSELATTGAYSLCRHPLYLGSFLMLVGFCLGTQPQINFPIVAPLVIVIYFCSIRSEERTLTKLFDSDWTNYAVTTPRLIPNPLRSKIRLSHWYFEQWRSNREYQAAFGAIAGIVGMFAWYAFA